MLKKIKMITLGVCISSISALGFATDLVSVYEQAVKSDPTFKEAQANWMATQQLKPMARSAFMPTINASGNWTRHQIHSAISFFDPPLLQKGVFDESTYSLSLEQPIFNFASWAALRQADAEVKSAGAQFNSAIQDLIFRTATAYFNVLTASSNLRFTVAAKKAFLQQLTTAQEKYKVGLIAITPLFEARASYDQAVEQEIVDRNELSNQLEALRAITGQMYTSLQSPGKDVPLIRPDPDNIDTWVSRAIKQNFELQAQHYATMAQMKNIGIQAGGHLPTVNLDANWTYAQPSGENGQLLAGYTFRNNQSVGLTLNMPIFQGGYVVAATRQARQAYAASAAKLEFVHRQVLANTRTSFLNVVAGISKIKANKQVIRSQKKAVETTEASYKVGTRTMVDVLDAYSNLYQSQATFAQAQYDYIISSLRLKQEAGTLGLDDIQIINHWLDKPLYFSKNKNSGGHQLSEKKPKNQASLKTQKSIKKTYTAAPKAHQQTMLHGYALQIFAAKNAGDAEEFCIDQPTKLRRQLRIIKKQQGGRTWYKVYYGLFESSLLAKNAIEHVGLKNYKPWVVKLLKNDKVVGGEARQSTHVIKHPAPLANHLPAPQDG